MQRLSSPKLPRILLWAAVVSAVLQPATAAAAAGPRQPNVLVVTIDTLRSDRLSAYGYPRPTSPQIDRLLASGVLFTNARTPEPLTGPALASMLTALYPHEHAASRNGLRIRERLPSLPKMLRRHGYATAAFVGNWTLRDKLTRLGEHFEVYQEVFSRRRWLGLFTREATGQDLTQEALAWLEEHVETEPEKPFFAWVHYVEPHAPYRFQKPFAPRLGIPMDTPPSRSDRYDTEVAFVDDEVGKLLAGCERITAGADTLVVFASDHGESLGEHDYWGHGRNVFDPNLVIPMGLAWPGHVEPGRQITAPASLLDLPLTVLGLLGLELPDAVAEIFHGYDWSGVIRGEGPPPRDRTLYFQAHKGAVLGPGHGQRARESGLLEVAILQAGSKEVMRVKSGVHRLFDLEADPGELDNQVPRGSEPSAELAAWLARVEAGLQAARNLPINDLDAESIERLKALGYVD